VEEKPNCTEPMFPTALGAWTGPNKTYKKTPVRRYWRLTNADLSKTRNREMILGNLH